MLVLNSVDVTVTSDDRSVIALLELNGNCDDIRDFQDEVDCIQTVQMSVFDLVPDTTCHFERRESRHQAADYVERGFGCCYDRATLIEQTLRNQGFQVRRTALYKRQNTPFHYLLPKIPSHALSEVKTREGWIFVGSIDPIIGVHESGDTYSLGDLRDGIDAGKLDDQSFNAPIPSNFYNGDFVYIYGVYSRHGFFFEPYIPVPEIAWSELGLR